MFLSTFDLSTVLPTNDQQTKTFSPEGIFKLTISKEKQAKKTQKRSETTSRTHLELTEIKRFFFVSFLLVFA